MKTISSPTSRVGHPALLGRYTRRDIIPITLDLIYGAWPKVCTSAVVDDGSHEPQIAGALFNELWKLRKTRRMVGPPYIDCESASRSHPELLIPDGRIDFKLIYGWDQEEFFSIECKRVSATNNSLATEYIREGVVRFTSGKYARGHDWAGMLAFVIDRNIPGTVKLINERLQTLASEVHLSGSVLSETSFGTFSNLYRSEHKPPNSRQSLAILHLYLCFGSVSEVENHK